MAERNPKTTIYPASPAKLCPLKTTGGELNKQRDLCRIKIKEGEYGGYKIDILTENLTKRDNALLTCEICEGIMREACISSSGKQFCSSCEVQGSKPRDSNFRDFSKQTPNVAVRKMINSLNCSCPLLERGCEWSGTLKDCEDHLDTCGYVKCECTLRCTKVLQRNELKVHEEEKCLQRIVRCEHCNGNFKFCELTTHTEMCPKMKVSCELKCGLVICRENTAHHLKQECGLVVEACELGCGTEMTRDELKTHVTDTCILREIPCESCGKLIEFCSKSIHIDKCPKKKVPCDLSCGVIMCREDMTQHLEQDCYEKEIQCPFAKYKCEMGIIKRKDLDKHLEEKETKHLGLKINAMEDIFLKHSEEVKQHREEMTVHREEVNQHRKEMNNQKNTINRMTEHINVLCSINRTTKLDWNIENISKFIQSDHSPQRRSVSGRDLNIYFRKEYIYVGYADTNMHRDNFSVKFLIRLYSTVKCKLIKDYDCGTVTIPNAMCSGEDKKEIVCIPKSDVEEFSRTGSANKLILEMYITKR